ncbi:MAG: hemerythrin family protein [Alphaproteobacteria bacterium]|nr:hemerythrin family protein [Alphaproteobacteria bacterium]MDE1986434.1 hemerythrin family protein [Alphaproteobacteria bacterium]MDE2163854.1 hemerythrin family protein [Alphaproteobacteria bacterium]MDE2264612.1 hemerythrin family protein [Alphaproteobacteria bacterium]MDE2501155.1 hemerythrin family protein [Alphaproteobacteria bacterium]
MSTEPATAEVAKPKFFLPDAALVHHGHIDEDHRELIAILNGLLAQADQRDMLDGALFRDTLQRLVARFERHFREEEAAMAALDYPDLAAHRQVHSSVMARVVGTQRDTANAAEVGAAEVHNLFNLALDDLLRADLGFKTYLAAPQPEDRIAASAARR